MDVTTRRGALLALGTAAVPVLAAGCGAVSGSSGTKDEAAPAKLKAGATLTYWNDMGSQYPTIMQGWADQFQQKTGVKVEATGGIASYADKLNAAFAGGSPPDLFRYLQEQIPIN